MKTPRLLALVLLISSVACTSCKTGGTPDGGPPSPVGTFVGIVADCGTTLGGPVAGAEIPKIVTALSGDPLNFGAVDAAVDGVISDLTNKGFLLTEAINFVACVAEGELGRAEKDSRLDDQIAARRVTNVRSWFAAHQVTFVSPGAARAGSR